jgi:rubrerythrin
MKKISMRSVKGWLSHDDIERLDEAAKRQLKYPKNPAKKYSCEACSYNWLYSSIRCPICSSTQVKRTA